MKQKKSAIFVSLLPTIKSLISAGYVQDSIIEKLKNEHDLELTKNTYKSYLARYAGNQNSSKLDNNDKTIISNKENNDIPAYKESKSTSTNSGFLSNFKKDENNEDDESNNDNSLSERQKMKGDVNKSRGKAMDLLNQTKSKK
ncbi:hypothetical protein ABH307_00435 [Acinetobacter pittii]|uniref:hypothetical protein n=1 Tax=Acinetobacter pittii TaxID=48296 RepID=UPI00326117B5